ncbi:MAG: YicC/YloC family endoribonuclease [bacterium]
MIKSMTGYGKGVVDLPARKLTIEIKSLNSKGLDLNVKIPAWFREKELDVRSLLATLQRGKIDLFISSESTSETLAYSINKPLAHKYYEELKELLHEFREDCPGGLLPLVVRMPDVLTTGRQEIDPSEWEAIRGELERAIGQVEEFRIQEGATLEGDIRSRVTSILALLEKVLPFEKERKEQVRQNLLKELDQLISSPVATRIDPNRFEQELIYYLERMDFTEEKVRLQKHGEFFLETLQSAESQGKKLGFITQEMGREINTLGSKASHAEIQKIVVQMKEELEKIREQLLNIL